jgi:hypothetical protein
LSEGLTVTVFGDVFLCGPDDAQRVGFTLSGISSPRGNAVSAEDASDCLWVFALNARQFHSEDESRASPRDPDNRISETSLREFRSIDSRRESDAGIGVEMIYVSHFDETVH